MGNLALQSARSSLIRVGVLMVAYPLFVDGGLEGAISGRALYEKTLDLKEANAWMASQQA